MKIMRYFRAHCIKPGVHELTMCGLDAYVAPSCFQPKIFAGIIEREEERICPECEEAYPLALLSDLP